MKNIRSFISSYAEGYLILVTLLCGYSPSLFMPPLFVGLVAILTFQLIVRNKVTGILIAGLFLLINVWMLLAVLFEFNQFLTATPNAIQLLGVGFLLFGFNLWVSILMLAKYLPRGERVPV